MWAVAIGCSRPEGDVDLAKRLRDHVEELASAAYEGRFTGSAGEALAVDYISYYFAGLGLEPAGAEGFLDPFEFRSGVRLAPHNRLVASGVDAGRFEVERDFRPLGFSASGVFGPAPVVFAGYGFAAPETEDVAAYDAYGDVDVEGYWLVVLRFWPEGASEAERVHWGRYTLLRYKATLARHRGALGILIANGPAAKTRKDLIGLALDGSMGSAGIPVLSIRDEVADALLAGTGHTLASLQRELDAGAGPGPFQIPGVALEAEVRLAIEHGTGHNVVARLPGRRSAAGPPVLIGAHLDHLGRGSASLSLAREGERGEIHYGADDNASGVAVLLESARILAAAPPARDVWFAAWSGEELGLLGSEHFAKQMESVKAVGEGSSHGEATANPHGSDLSSDFIAYLNLDMVGRLRKQLILQGVGSSSAWPALLERYRATVPLLLQTDAFLPTDAATFVLRRVPVASFFTGAHPEYHTPRDTPDLLNYEGLQRITRVVVGLATDLGERAEPLDFVPPPPPKGGSRSGLRAYLGTIPDYASEEVGLRLAGVAEGGPAHRAGLRAGDVVVALSGREVRDIYDYTYAMETLRIGEPATIAVRRGDRRLEFEITPESRQ